MGRRKVKLKHEVMSISLPPSQINFVNTRPKFNLSKFVQIHLQDYIDAVQELEELKNDKK